MFDLSTQIPITIEEFFSEYPANSWLGFIEKTDDKTKHYPMDIGNVLSSDYSGKQDVYLAYNPLKQGQPRKKANVKKLALLFVDLDIGRDDSLVKFFMRSSYKESTIKQLEAEAFGKTVPEPNFICDSGRGLYLLYKIYQNEEQTVQEHKKATLRWRRVNSFLTSQLEMFESDRAVATDEARVLRIPGSVNSHSNTEVKFYRYSDNVYTLHRIEQDYMNAPTEKQLEALHKIEEALDIKCDVLNRRRIRRFMAEHEAEYKKYKNKQPVTEKQLAYARDIAKLLDISCPKFRTYGGANKFIKRHEEEFKRLRAEKRAGSSFLPTEARLTNAMLENRLLKIEKVLIDASPDSFRETGLFFYRLFALEYTRDKEVALQMMLDVNGKMKHPLSNKIIRRTTRPVEDYFEADTIYKMKDETLARWFDMSAEEWKDLLPFEKKEDKELRKARNRRYYEAKLVSEGKTTKAEKIQQRREEIQRLCSEGNTKNEICEILHISVRTYYSDLQALEEEKESSAQDKVESCAEKLDAYSNSVPLGTNPLLSRGFTPVSTSSGVSASFSFIVPPFSSGPPGG